VPNQTPLICFFLIFTVIRIDICPWI